MYKKIIVAGAVTYNFNRMFLIVFVCFCSPARTHEVLTCIKWAMASPVDNNSQKNLVFCDAGDDNTFGVLQKYIIDS